MMTGDRKGAKIGANIRVAGCFLYKGDVDMAGDYPGPHGRKRAAITGGGGTVPARVAALSTASAANARVSSQHGEEFVVSLRVQRSENVLTVSDDGPGFKSPETNTAPRYGLAVMRGLAVQLGGTLEISDGPGATIRVAFG